MVSLPMIHHVPGAIGLQLLHSIIDRRDIGGGIVETTVALTDDHGLVFPLFDFLVDEPGFIRGDANRDWRVDISDVVFLLRFLKLCL